MQDESARNNPGQPVCRTAPDATQPAAEFPIVGIGASAGGLKAIECLFRRISPDSGMTFVVVQHLDPTHKSILSELLGRKTEIPVQEVTHGLRVKPDHIYVIPANRDLSLQHGTLQLTEPSGSRHLRLSIDHFFRSLAQDQGGRAVGVVLSGTGTDGTLGIRAIKGEGGLVLVQDPDSAAYDGMPRSAIATGLADAILPPDEMARQLQAYARQSQLPGMSLRIGEPPIASGDRVRLFALVRNQTGHDFSLYKEATISRRIRRRMALHQIGSEKDYVRYLQHSPPEIDALWRDFLIPVTQFFRNPKAFELLKNHVLPALLEDRKPSETLRVWMPACSTGEEAYSLAILMREHMEWCKREHNVQIFATDIDEGALKTARAGAYPESIVSDVSQDHLRRFFSKEGDRFIAGRTLRSMLVFSSHNVIKDPPFSHIDLVSCRNLLIYMMPELQTRVLALAHYALNPGGFLLLGDCETTGAANDLFEEISKKWRLYRRRDVEPSRSLRPAHEGLSSGMDLYGLGRYVKAKKDKNLTLRETTEQALLEDYAPTCVVVDHSGQMLYVHGSTGTYLEAVTGKASLNIVHLARDGLRLLLAAALREVASEHRERHYQGLPLEIDGETRHVDITVRPFPAATPRDALMVLFGDSRSTPPAAQALGFDPGSEAASQITALEQELSSTREVLQTANEELQTSNEELGSTVQELQSTNEELQTSQEELRSVNEELLTVNTELQNKVEELDQEKSDMENLLASTEIGTVFLDLELRVKRFTPAVLKLINLLEQDIGRPLAHIAHNLEYADLMTDVETVRENLTACHRELRDHEGSWYTMGITLYRTPDHAIEGLVLTFVDITERKQAEEEFRALVENAPDATIISNRGGEIVLINSQTERLLGYNREELIGREVELLLPHWQGARHRDHRARFTRDPKSRPMGSGLDLSAITKDGRELPVEISLAPLQTRSGLLVSASIREVSEQRLVRQVLRRNLGLYRTFCHWTMAQFEGQDPQESLHDFCHSLVKKGGYRRCRIDLTTEGNSAAPNSVSCPQQDAEALDPPWPVLGSDGEPVVIRDVLYDPAHADLREHALEWHFASAVALPLRVDGRSIGSLIIHAAEANAFSDSELELLMSFSNILSRWCSHGSEQPLCGKWSGTTSDRTNQSPSG